MGGTELADRLLTKQQLTGLLWALGEYAIRVGPDYTPEGVADPELVEAHRSLVGFYWRARVSPWSQAPPIFDPREQKDLSLHKYIGGLEGINKQELRLLLVALGRYSTTASAMKVPSRVLGGVARIVHAHNALLAFGDRPFTQDEFGESVRAVLRGEMSHLTRPSNQPASPAADAQP
jgi:hypothetical protein